MAREYLHSKNVKNFLSKVLRKIWFCQLYDHTYLVDINKDTNSPTVLHVLFCGHCRTIFGNMSFPYMAYRIKGVNPQSGTALMNWIETTGLRDPVIEDLVSNLQKFRSKKGAGNVDNSTSKKNSGRKVRRSKRVIS